MILQNYTEEDHSKKQNIYWEVQAMSRFELFCMIFYVLDTEWNETKDAQLGGCLSGADPFLFKEACSADPAVYDTF